MGYRGTRTCQGFTLIELLSSTGIIGLILAILLPALNGVRSSARLITCTNNVRQLCHGLFVYADGYRGLLPMNVTTPKAYYWYDSDRSGRILSPSQSFLMGSVAACPEDSGGLRSYAMNIWASYAVDKAVHDSGYGTQWHLAAPNASRYILVAEKWSTTGSNAAGWMSVATIGASDTPGRRFGGGVGISPVLTSNHFGQANCELPFQRHRISRSSGRGTQPIGRVNIGYADGHVALKSNDDLVDSVTGLSTLDSWWSPIDDAINH